MKNLVELYFVGLAMAILVLIVSSVISGVYLFTASFPEIAIPLLVLVGVPGVYVLWKLRK